MKNILSVIIPTYNRAKYLGESLDSVISQKLPVGWKMEVIVVDDGSTDNTDHIIKSYVERGIKYYKIKHSGSPAIARNYAIRRAKGSLIAFQDSDDKWADNKLIKQRAIFEDESISLSYGNAEVMTETGKKTGKTIVSDKHLLNGAKFESLLKENVISTLTVIARKKCIVEVGGFDETKELIGVEDYELWLRILSNNPNIFLPIQKTLAFYRRHDNNVSNVSTLLANEKLFLLMEKLYDKIDDSTTRKTLTNEILVHGHALSCAMDEADSSRAPIISIIMSVFNGQEYLRDAIDSVLNQTYDNFEFIIIDDGSSDDSIKIIKSYSDPRIRLITQTNHGLVYSLNKGAALARGGFVARQDADDISMPTRLEKQLNWMLTSHDRGLVGTFFTYIDLKNKPLTTTICSPLKDLDLKRSMYLNNPFAHGSVMFRKQAFLESNGYRQEYYKAEDYDLWRRIARKWEIGQVPEILYWYRINPSGISQNNGIEQKNLTNRIIRQQYHEVIYDKSYSSVRDDFYYYKNLGNSFNSIISQQYKDQQIHLAFNFFIYGYIRAGLRTTLGSFMLQPKLTVKRLWRIVLWSPFKKVLGKSL